MNRDIELTMQMLKKLKTVREIQERIDMWQKFENSSNQWLEDIRTGKRSAEMKDIDWTIERRDKYRDIIHELQYVIGLYEPPRAVPSTGGKE